MMEVIDDGIEKLTSEFCSIENPTYEQREEFAASLLTISDQEAEKLIKRLKLSTRSNHG